MDKVINRKYQIKNSDGTFSTVYFETSVDQIITSEEKQFISKKEKDLIAESLTFEFLQGNPSSQWSIQHNLNKYPSVIIMDNFRNLIVGEISYLNKNIVVISFNQPVSGIAYLK